MTPRSSRLTRGLTVLVVLTVGVIGGLALAGLSATTGNREPLNGTHTVGHTPASTSATPPPVRAMYGGTDFQALSTLGVDTVHTTVTLSTLDQLEQLGMRAVVWLGEYHRSTCTFEYDNDQVQALVAEVAGHPAIAAYQVADEPRTTDCPDATADIAARSDLIQSIDDSVPTYVTVDAWNGRERFPYGDFAGTTDIMGLVVYPCQQGHCDLDSIDEAIARADEAGVERYWAVVQGFADDYYTLPDPDVFAAQLDRWTASRAEGIAVFSWSFGTDDVSRSTELQAVIREAWTTPPPAVSPAPEP